MENNSITIANPILFLVGMITFLVMMYPSQSSFPCPIFNFGDSNSDTGYYESLSGGLDNQSGRIFFNGSTGRFCDGRLIIDFICQNASHSLLKEYLGSFDEDFQSGANFAIAGARAKSVEGNNISLHYQIQRFMSFRSLVKSQKGSYIQISQFQFERAIYMFDIGQNDINVLAFSNASAEETSGEISLAVAEIKININMLYNEVGARKFWIHNTGPLGCLPLFAAGVNDYMLDDVGCVVFPNNLAHELNNNLHNIVEELRTLPNATIIYVDIFSIKYNLFANYISYGFEKRFQGM